MDTLDTVVEVNVEEKKPKRGRPFKTDKSTPMGDYIAEQAKKSREKQGKNNIVEKYYELYGTKLLLCKKTQKGTVHRTLIGTTTDKKHGEQIKAHMKKIQAEGKLRIKV